MNKILFPLVIAFCFLFFSLLGCGTTTPTATTTTSTATSTSTSTTTATSTSTTTSTTIFSSLNGKVKVPSAIIGSSALKIMSNDGVSDTALANAIIIAVDASGEIIAGTSSTTSDANGNFTLYNLPLNTPFYLKITKEVNSEIILVQDLTSMETSTKTNEAVNALSSLVAQRVKNICDTASMGGFSQLQDINPIDVTRLLSYQINVLTTAPTLKAASESAVRSNLLLSYNSLTQESTTLEALDDSSQAQLLVGAAQTSTQRKTAAWKFFEAAGFGVPTIESLSLTGHGGRTTAMPLIPESVINSAEAFLANNYKWNLAGILYALNRVASWEIHYTETSNPGSAAHQALLLPAIMASGGGSIIQSGLLDSNSYTVIGANNAPTIEAGSFATMLYGTIPSYEGYCTLIRNTERPNSPTWEIPSIISVVTLAFPASFWDTTPNDPSDARVFDASTQLNVLQSYALIYFRVLKCQGLNTTPPAPYFNHALWIQYDSRPNIETELMQYLYESKL